MTYGDTLRFVYKGDTLICECSSYIHALEWIVDALPLTGYRISDRRGDVGR